MINLVFWGIFRDKHVLRCDASFSQRLTSFRHAAIFTRAVCISELSFGIIFQLDELDSNTETEEE